MMTFQRDAIADDYDYVIVGAGSAGCVLAARLGEDSSVRILVLEAGGANRSIFIAMPSGFAKPMQSRRYNWGLKSDPEPGLGGRRVNLPRGRGLGGSSSINGMCYVRGNPLDYELWHRRGATGWTWRNVLPYFQRAEGVAGAGPLRGRDGPLKVRRGREHNPLYAAFIEAGAQAGYARSPNMNERQHEGFGPMEMTISGGVRCSTARAYLAPAVRRGNVQVATGAEVQRILFDGRIATGVEYMRGGRRHAVRARQEVLLCAGSIMSPVLLKRSGVGPGAELREAGIATVLDSPEVGENLMDHMEVHVQFRCTQPLTLGAHMTPLGKARIGARWLLRRDGLGATNHFEAGAHIRSRAGIPYPDIQMHFLPLAISYDAGTIIDGHGMQVHVGTKRSKSRGWVRLRPEDPTAPPRVVFNYMSHEDDWVEMRAAVRLTREIFAQPAFASYCGPELSPGAACGTDAEIDDFLRAEVVTAHHPCGTCRMGSDARAVVAPDGRVRGLDRLRVIDSSVFPQATAGDLNGPTIMLAERISDMLRGRTPLIAEEAPILVAADWDRAQRSGSITRDLSSQPDEIDAVLSHL